MGYLEQQNSAQPYLHYVALRLLSACSFGLGIGFAHTHQPALCVLFIAATIGYYTLTQSIQKTFLLLLFFTTGYSALYYQYTQHNNTIRAIENRTLNIEAVIESIEPVQHTLYRYIIIAHAHKTTDTQTNLKISVPWRIQCYTHLRPTYEIGDTVAFEGIKINRIPESSFYTYLVKEQVHATVFLKSNACRIVTHPHFHLQRSVHTYRKNLLARIRAKCPRTAFTLFASIFLGNRNCVKKQYQDIKERFHHWGIMHFLARSGLHLVLFILLLQLALQRIPAPLFIKHIFMIFTAGVYTIFSWSSISFARACTTFGWYKFCHIYDLQIDVTTIILLLSCIFLLINPALLLFLDFQLSFGLTLILSLINQLGTA